MSKTKKNEEFSLKELRRGNRAEFAKFVEKYYEYVYRLVNKMLGNQQDAEDVLQETFIKVYRHLKGFDGRSSLSTWLYRIAINEALMFLRKQKPNLVSVDDYLETEEGEREALQIVDWRYLPEEELLSSEVKAYLNQAIKRLSPSLRIVFILRDIQGFSTRETSQVLELSETAVKTRLSRARMRLRAELTDYFSERVKTLRGDY